MRTFRIEADVRCPQDMLRVLPFQYKLASIGFIWGET